MTQKGRTGYGGPVDRTQPQGAPQQPQQGGSGLGQSNGGSGAQQNSFASQIPGIVSQMGDVGSKIMQGQVAAQQAKMQQPPMVSPLVKYAVPFLIGGVIVYLWLKK